MTEGTRQMESRCRHLRLIWALKLALRRKEQTTIFPVKYPS